MRPPRLIVSLYIFSAYTLPQPLSLLTAFRRGVVNDDNATNFTAASLPVHMMLSSPLCLAAG